jgi:hypothetical protein
MFENATTLQIQPGALEEALTILRAEIAPILHSQAGLCSLGLVPNRAAGTLSVLSLWETERDARAVESQWRYRRAIAALDPLLADQTVYLWRARRRQS